MLRRPRGARERLDTARATLGAGRSGRSAREARRFRVLAGAAEAADGRLTIEETARRLGDLLVPELADVAILDVVHEGTLERLHVRATGPDRVVIERTLGARRLTAPPHPRSADAVAAGRAQLIAPVTDELLRAGAEGAAELEALRAAGIGASIVVPLVARGRALGALTLLTTRASGRTFVSEELEFIEVLAGRIALALDNAGLFVELQTMEARLSAALGSLTEAVTILNRRGTLIYANDAAAAMLGYASPQAMLADTADAIIGRYESFHEDGSPVDPSEFPGRRLLAGEDAPPLVMRVVDRETGEQRWRTTKASAVRDGEGRITMLVHVITDISAAKEVERTQRLLAAAGEVLTGSRDYEHTLEVLAELCVPELAELAAVVVPDGHGYLRARAVAHRAPVDAESARWLREEHAAAVDAPFGVAKAFRTGEVVVSNDITDAQLAAVSTDPQNLAGLKSLGMRSALAIPLIAGDTTVGVLSLINTGIKRSFSEHDVTLSVGIARRAADAIETARLYTERSLIAATLQRSLLPDALPEMAGWKRAALYRPAGEETWVGGDFYEILHLGPDWLLVVGDVTGRGAEAAALTALMRHTLRTAARLTGSVSEALAALNRELVGRPEQALCTAVCVRLRAAGEGSVAEIICAGHPKPVLVRDGEARYVGGFGSVLGAFADESWEPTTVALTPGDVLVLYSDGVLDTVGEKERFGPERLSAALADARGAEGAVAAVEEALSAFAVGPQADDTAVLAVAHVVG